MLRLLRKDLHQLKSMMLTPLVIMIASGIISGVRMDTVRFAGSTIVLFAIVFAPHVVIHEVRSKTLPFLKALPVQPGTIVAAKFGWFILFAGAQLALGWLFYLLSGSEPGTPTILSLAWATFGSLGFGSILLMLQFVVPRERTTLVLVVAAMVAMGIWVIVDLNLRLKAEDTLPSTFFNTGTGYGVAVVAGLAVAAGSCRWASHVFARRDLTELG